MSARPPREGRRPRRRLRLVFASAELAPLALTGGLGEAVAGLARALAARGHQVACWLPAWKRALESPDCPPLTDAGPAAAGAAVRAGRWLDGELCGVGVGLLDLPGIDEGSTLYGDDDARRFIAFSRAVAARAAAERPHVLVAHDWHAALAVCALRTLHDFGPARGIGTVQVIHNNAFQGRFPAAAMALTGLPGELFHPDGLEFWGDLCLLKGGLAWAERLVAVSPTHAVELQRPEFGAGLDGLYRTRAGRLVGIANGIDVERFDPARDAALPARFSADSPGPKSTCRAALVDAFGLRAPEPGRLLVTVGRLSEQKGWDVLVEAIPRLVERGASLVLLGDGDPGLAGRLRAAARRWPARVHLSVGWDDALSRRLFAGADCVLVPSRFEPCGLVQRIAQRYGTLPIAHRVGGLVDTIEDGETGVLFAPLTAAALVEAVERAALLLRERDAEKVRRSLLELDVSWSEAAARYESVLDAVAREGAGRR